MKTMKMSCKKNISKYLIVFLIAQLPAQFILAQPAPWLGGWLYRSSVTVTNSIATALSDFQVQISLNTGNFNFNLTDGNDIRITGSDGTTLIPFWIEDWTQDATASIWVKVPSIPASGITTLFLYYGNDNAQSASSGLTTFDFFDDFESWSVTPRPVIWQDHAPLPTPSADNTISVYDNKLYSFGGYGLNHLTLNTTYEYDPSVDLWTYKAPMPTSRWGMVSVEFDGNIFVFGGDVDRYGTGTNMNEIYNPATDVWTSRALGNPLPLLNYGASGAYNPDVIYFPSGEDGYEYWMMYSPYTQQLSKNPSILRSHDGIRWTDNGITNPVIPDGESGEWNALENTDHDFIYVSEINKWFMVWTGRDTDPGSRRIALAYSSDGKTWTQYYGASVNGNTNPVILSGSDNYGADWERNGFGSQTCTPSLFYQDGTFYLFYGEEASGANRGQIGLASFTWNNTINSIVGLTRNPGNPIINLPTDANFKSGGGHIEIAKNQGSNTYRMYVVRELLNSSNFELGLVTSSNLTSGWTSQGKVIERGTAGQWDETHIYRSSPVVSSSGEIVLSSNTIRMYYSAFRSDNIPGIGIADISEIDGSVVKFFGSGPIAIPAEIAHQGLMAVRYGSRIHLFYKNYHYEYNPVSDTYLRKNDVPHSRTWGTCAVVGDNIYIIGGYNYDPGLSGGSADNQMLNINSDTWEDKAPCPHARYGSTRENPVIDGKIYVTHGWNDYWFYTANYMYDPVTDTWEQKGSAIHPRDGVACGVIDEKLYVIGGRNVPTNTYGLIFNEVYDPDLDIWVPAVPPSAWTTSGANFVFSSESARHQGNNGLIIRDPMDGSPGILYYAQTTAGFGSVYALDFDWNATTLGGISSVWEYPQVTLRLTEDWLSPGMLYFLERTEGPTLRWFDRVNEDWRWTDLQSSTWDAWHKVTVIRNGENSQVIFDGDQHTPLNMITTGAGQFRFGSIMSTQYLDNVRVRKWAGTNLLPEVGIMEAFQGQWTGASDTDWNNGSNWSDGIVPGVGVNVIIPLVENQPVITSSALCNNITINSGATLRVNDLYSLAISSDLINNGSLITSNQSTITLEGDWINNGSFTAEQSTVVFNGTSQEIGGGTFHNLTLTGYGTKTFVSTAIVSGTLNATSQNITISTGASLTINPSGKANVGLLTNNGTLNLNSDAMGIASLIVDSYVDNGTENIQLYLTGGGDETNYPWHYISSPVATLSVADVVSSGSDPASIDLAAYYENMATISSNIAWWGYDGWNYQSDNGLPQGSTFSILEVGRGYNYYCSYDATRIFGGNLNTGTVPKVLTYSSTTYGLETYGWNLLGNPFTSSIDWDGVSKPSFEYLDQAIYFTHDNSFASYVYPIGNPVGTTGIIPPMQGFFVKAKRPGGTIFITEQNKVHGDHNRYKGDKESIPLLRLKIENKKVSDETVIHFDEKATKDFDPEWDAYKFSKTGTAVSLWTIIGPVNYSINTLPFPEAETEIPVGIYAIESGTYKLTAFEFQALNNFKVYLIDKITANVTDLKTNPSLNFTTSEGMVTDRFVIKIINISTSIENPVILASSFNIYSSRDFVNIQTLSDEWDGKSGSVDIIDMTGKTFRKIDNTEFLKNSLIQIPTSGLNGLYFIKMQSGLLRHVGKVMIK